MTPADEALVAAQYADRPQLRPVLDALLEAALDLDGVHAVARRTQVSLVGPLRTFAIVQATTRSRVDVALRLAAEAPGGKVQATRGVEFPLRLELRSVDDVDAEALAWLRRTAEENAAPRPRRRSAPRPQVTARRSVRVVIEGSNLPGRSCNPEPDGRVHRNVHVGLRHNDPGLPGAIPSQQGSRSVVDVVPGDAPQARWELDVVVERHAGGGHDVRGRWVGGRRGERGIGLDWGDLTPDGRFLLFRGLGLRFSDVDASMLDRAIDEDVRLVARLGLTDAKGNPRCASVRPPDVTWALEPAGAPAR